MGTDKITVTTQPVPMSIDDQLAKLLKLLVSAVLERSGGIAINRTSNSMAMLYEIVIDKEAAPEVGRLYGRDGSTLAAIRRIMVVAGARHGIRRMFVDVINPYDERREFTARRAAR